MLLIEAFNPVTANIPLLVLSYYTYTQIKNNPQKT